MRCKKKQKGRPVPVAGPTGLLHCAPSIARHIPAADFIRPRDAVKAPQYVHCAKTRIPDRAGKMALKIR
ncbi:hypothetical protein [Cupriavidus basilensis]|uniref:hypothetical protein n=1 Tax=Cupriavidus basilensis TaxID=68895 RepID=UPI0012E0830C|nr:hypothetical protein [Cupriavidus basilensis]